MRETSSVLRKTIKSSIAIFLAVFMLLPAFSSVASFAIYSEERWISEQNIVFGFDEVEVDSKNPVANLNASAQDDTARFTVKIGTGAESAEMALSAALTAAGDSTATICLTTSGSIYGNYTIPKNVTLLIPFDDNHTCIKEMTADNVLGGQGVSVSGNYRKLTVASGAKITVNGSVSVSSKVSSVQGYLGSPSGRYGQIQLDQGSSITLNSGSKLYVWGYVTGAGEVIANNEAEVFELFQIADFRGGSETLTMVSCGAKTFPFSQYYVQNIEASLRINYGATEKTTAVVYMSSTVYLSTVSLISKDDPAMFLVKDASSYVIKRYEPSEDRLYVDFYGNGEIGTITVSLGSYSFSTSKYALPINSNITVTINSGATVSCGQKINLLPASSLVIKEGAQFDVLSSGEIYLYDRDEWINRGFVDSHKADFQTVGYSPTKTKTRNASDLIDASVYVNGTISLNGKMFSTSSGADVTGRDYRGIGDSGKVSFVSAAPTKAGSTTQWIQGSESDTSIPANSVWLHNGIQASSTDYVTTVSSPANTKFDWDPVSNKWIQNPVTVTYSNNFGDDPLITVQKLVKGTSTALGQSTKYTGDPYNALTREGYTFVDWTTNADGSGTHYTNGQQVSLTNNLTLYAQWRSEGPPTYTVTWKNYDGSDLGTTEVENGVTPVYTGETPTKAADANYTYTFAGWSDGTNTYGPSALPAVTGDVTYTAVFTPHDQEYTFVDNSWVWTGDDANGYTAATASFVAAVGGFTKTVSVTATPTSTKPATCEEAGNKVYTALLNATDSPDHSTHSDTKTVMLPALDHNYVSVVTEPTCTEQGYTTHTCSRCEDSYVDTYVDALGHDWSDWSVTTPADCTEEGVETRTCSRCNETETRPLEALGHYYVAVVTVPTCTEQGYTTHTCSRCGDSYVDAYVAALGHDWGEWTVTTEPTCTETGEETRTCSRCGATETQVVAALGHDYKAVVTDPTCTERGFTTYTCSRCGDSYVDDYVDALGHDLVHHDAKAATCTEIGWEAYDTCSRCDYTTYEEIPALGHDLIHHDAKAATCTEKGWKAYDTCTRCDYTTYEEIAALGHDWNTPTWTWGEGYASATAEFICKNDSSHVETVTTTDISISETVETTTYTATVEFNGQTYTGTEKTARKYTITFVNGEIELQSEGVAYGTSPVYHGQTPTRDPDAQYAYVFSGWTDGTNTYGKDDTLPVVKGEVTYTATFATTTKTYTVTWLHENGNELEKDENVPYGTTPVYNGEEPTKAATSEYTYTFEGWTPEVKTVTGNATYTAVFKGHMIVSADGVEATYKKDLKRHITVHAPEGAAIWYSETGRVDDYREANYDYEDVNEYTVYYKVTKDGYDDVFGSATVKITQAEPNVTLTMAGWTYGGTASDPVLTGDYGNALVTYSYILKDSEGTYSTEKPSNAGTYVVKADIGASQNYIAKTVTAEFTIEKVTPTVTPPTHLILNFTGNLQELVIAGRTNYGTLVYSLSENDGYSEAIPTGVNVGNYVIYYKVKGDNNINDTEPASVTSAICAVDSSVATAPVGVEGLVYNGNARELVTSGTAVGGTMTYRLGDSGTFSETIPTRTDAGTYTVYYQVVGDENHGSTGIYGPITVTIAKATISPVVSIEGWTYGDAANEPSVSGNLGNGEVTYEYMASTENDYSSKKPTNAGTHTVKATVAETDNYYGGTATAEFTIGKATLTVTANPKTITYGDEPANNGVTFEGFKNGDGEGIFWYLDGTQILTKSPDYTYTYHQYDNVGEYEIIPSGLENDNYDITFVPGKLTVVAKEVTATVTVDPTSYQYDGTAKEPAVTVKDGERTIDPSEYTVSYSNNVNVGTATVTVTDKEDGNYVVSGTCTFTITEAPATVTKAPTAKSGLVYNGSGQALVDGGEASGGTMKYSLDGTNWSDTVSTGTNAGKYTVYYKVFGDGNHSDSAVASVEVTIAQKTLNVEVAAHDKTYDGGDTADGTVILKGIVSGDSVSATADSIKFDDENVGTGKTVIFSGITLIDASGNYTLGDVTSATTTADITAKDVTITGLGAADKVYDGTTAATVTGTAVIDGKIGDDDVTVVLGTASFADANVGEGKTVTFTGFSLTGNDAGNYNLTAQPASVTANITAATMDVSAEGYSGTYVGAEHSIKVTAPEGATVTYSATEIGEYTATNPAYKNAGTYTVYYKVTRDNYADKTGSATVAIKKAALTVTAEAKSKTYGENDPALTYSVEGLVTGDSLEGALTRAEGENVGMYAITQGTLSAGDNYTITYFAANLTITKAKLTVTAEAKSKTYGEADPALTYQVSGLVNGDTKSVVTGSLTREAGNDVGDYDITIGTLSAGSNYEISFTGAKLTITKATLTVTANAQAKVYGAADPELTYTSSGLVGEDKLTGVLTRAEGENVGEYNITIGTLTAGDNYTISYTGAKLTINPKTLTVTAEAKSKTYGDRDPELTYTSSGLVGDDKLTGALTRESGENVGTYAITQGDLSAGNNYTISFTGANLTIGAKTLTIKADPKTKVFGTEDPELTYTVEGLVTGDSLTGALTRASGENVGTYAITQGTLTASTNYDVSFTGATFTITDAEMEVKSSGYNGTYDGLPHGITVTAPAGATVKYSTDGETFTETYPEYKDVGERTVYYMVEKANYTTFTGSETVVITKAPLTVTAKDKTITYGDEPANDGVAYVGFVNGETEAVLTGTLQYTYGYAQFGNVGTYSITPSGLSSGNYDITFNAGTLTVEQKTVGLTWSETSLTYNGNAQAPVATATGLVNDDACTVTVEGQKTDVGTYTAEAKALSNGNYKLPAETTVQFTIANASMSGVTSSDYVGTYDGQPHGITVNAPEGATVTYSAAADGTYVDSLTYVNAGEYTVYFKVVKANYETVTGSQKVTINKREVTLTWSDTSFTYDESAKCPTVAVGNLVDGDTCTAIVSGAAANAGPHTATVTGLSNDNYVLPSTNLTQEYTIAKAAKAAPNGVDAVAETYLNQKNGSITGVNGEMEYSVDGTNYVAVTGESETIENLPAGTYYVRYKETENYNASPAVEITVAAGPAIKVTWKVDGQEDRVQDYAYGDTPSYGSTPTKAAEAGHSYVFAGWVLAGSDPEHFLAEGDTVTGPVTYTAQFKLRNCLNIHRDAAAEQDFLYVIKGTSEGNSNVNTQVVLRKGEKDVYVVGLPDGKYEVTEVATWSWRVTPVNRMLTATFSANANLVTVTFGASSALTKWLNAFASVVNVITGTNG